MDHLAAVTRDQFAAVRADFDGALARESQAREELGDEIAALRLDLRRVEAALREAAEDLRRAT